MMTPTRQPLLLVALLLGLSSCKHNATTTPQDTFSIGISPKKKEYHLGDTLQISIRHPRFEGSVQQTSYQIHQQPATTLDDRIVLESLLLGKQFLSVSAQTNDDKQYTVKKPLLILAQHVPKLLSYRILSEYPHNKEAYTQGLEFIGDTLVESAGQYKQSSIRKWNPFTGEIHQNVPLQPIYFGEGSMVFRGKILQLTWYESIGFVYGQQLKVLKAFAYGKSKEGWGLCHNGIDKLYKSDGTEKIWLLHPETFAEIDSLQLCTGKSLYTYANELELANGKIYANTFLKDGIMIINPESGVVGGVVDVHGLKDKVEKTPDVDVLNGVACHPIRHTFFITGKNWSKVFEIVFLPDD